MIGIKSCYELNVFIKKGTLLIANDAGDDFDLTKGRTYVATKNQGEDTLLDCVFVIDDTGQEVDYTSEYFYLHENELDTESFK